jgi:hypothetical protein
MPDRSLLFGAACKREISCPSGRTKAGLLREIDDPKTNDLSAGLQPGEFPLTCLLGRKPALRFREKASAPLY